MTAPLLHFAAAPLTAVLPSKQHPAPCNKPSGLWVSVGTGADGWPARCPAKARLAHATQIVLRAGATVLRIGSIAEIEAFHARWAASHRPQGHRGVIAWRAVAAEHAGIVIAPHLRASRLDGTCPWYAAWDGACGCIWDADALERLVPRADIRFGVPAMEAA